MNVKNTLNIVGIILILLMIGTANLYAQQRAVTRYIENTAYVEGSTKGSNVEELERNMPIFDGDDIWTNSTGFLGIMTGNGNIIWMDSSTRLHIDQLPASDQGQELPLRLKVWKGSILLDLSRWNPSMASFTLATPSGTMSPASGGLYLIEVESVDRSSISALQGSCIVSCADSSVKLERGQMTYADYGYPPISPVAAGSYGAAALLAFREDSMPRRTSGVSAQYLPGSLASYSDDFDNNGRWVNTQNYGRVWHPTVVAAGWSPYMYGRWWWGPGGMTWVPAEAWGWVPFHYGRWTFMVGIGWSWIPMPYYAPAWVAWYWGSSGYIGWCPLGYYGNPYWHHCGWYSVPVTHVYRRHVHRVIVRHHSRPQARPILPRPIRLRPGHNLKDGRPVRSGPKPVVHPGSGPVMAGPKPVNQRGGGLVKDGAKPAVRPEGPAVSPINLSPGMVRDYANGRTTIDRLKRKSSLPVSTTTSRRNFPTINPSVNRSDVQPSRRAPLPSFNRSLSTGAPSRDRSTTGRQPAHGQSPGVYNNNNNGRGISNPTRRSSGLANSSKGTTSSSPRRTTRGGYTQPSSGSSVHSRSTGSRSRSSASSSTSRSRSSSSSRSKSSGSSYKQRYVPSRSSSGMSGGSRSSSKPSKSSSSSGNRRKHR